MMQTIRFAIKNIANLFGKICLQPAYLLPILLLFSQQNAHADVYGFIDEKGVAHFAAERVDARYELFFKGGESFDTQQGIASKDASKSDSKNPANASNAVTANSSAASSAAKDKANSKIQAYFDVSTNFKATEELITKLMGKGEASSRRELMELHGDTVEVDI